MTKDCGCDCHTRSPKDVEREAAMERYREYVEENQTTIRAIEEIINRHVEENRPGDPWGVYEWPESEAVVILQHWDEIKAAVTRG